MCGRFSLVADPNDLREAFPWLNIPEGILPRYNISPTQPIAVIPNDGKNTLDYFTWGLVPSWAKDPSIGSRMINARAETLQEKPAFRSAFRRRRCLIPATGFYEWKQDPASKAKTPMYIHMKSGALFAFAGLWETWQSPEGSTILSGAIITTEPNALMSKIHNRMPVILPPQAYAAWLEPGDVAPERLAALLKPYPADEMTAYVVSRQVNNPANETPGCIVQV